MPQLTTAYNITCKKVVNNSSLDYFVPLETKFEWDSFASNTPPNVSVVNCDCTSFEYSPWSACVNGFQTRYLISSTPTGCIGSPVLSQACNCNLVGCPTGTDCRQGTLYYGSTKCQGGSNPISPTCVANSIPYYACQKSGNVSRIWWGVANNLCTTIQACPTPTAGCPAGFTCVKDKVYLSSSNCTTGYAGPDNGPYCHPFVGQEPNTCAGYATDFSVYIYTATGCNYNP